ncbi:hypothetical protein CC78DRAFT_586876 [Lojkania enalia]|uniref:Rhodopsin domain-containing protein n=1 Tax=Lojkania enalia TaxID=147567 RepID=A0A9P4JZP1_9PLEO|nr:hypothetical protein CC78DRAFT_586876 [Didymosphaeria enalia]
MSDLSHLTQQQMANLPLQTPPPGVNSNFDNPETTGPVVVITLSIFLAIALLTVPLRIYCRVSVVKRTGLDDWLALVALVFCCSIYGVTMYLVSLKVIGPHSWNVRLVLFISPKVQGSLLALQLLSCAANFLAKASILLFVRRLFPRTVSPKTSYAIDFGIVANCIAYLVIIPYTSILCIPRVGSNGQSPSICTQKKMIDQSIGSAATNAALDLYVFAVAMPSLWILQMPLKRKLSVVAVLAVGLSACAISLVTLYLRAANNLDDPSRKTVNAVIFSGIEPLLAVTTASLPAMPALWVAVSAKSTVTLRRLVTRITSSTTFGGSRRRTGYELSGLSGENSIASLDTHGMTRTSDLERGEYKTPYSVTES